MNRICAHKQKTDTQQLNLAVLFSKWQPNGEQSKIKSGLGAATVTKQPNKVKETEGGKALEPLGK